MTYADLSTVNATTDLSNLLLYVNNLTNGYAMPSVLVAFFLIIFLGGSFYQIRFRGDARWDFSFAVAGFITFGMAMIMSQKNGLLNPLYLLVSLAVAILGAVWLYMTPPSEL